MKRLFVVSLISLLCIGSHGALAATPLSRDSIEDIRAFVQSYADRNAFSGVVVVARDGVPVFGESFGMADRETGARPTIDTAFYVGSIEKQFIAAAILLLQEDGKLSLDDPIREFYAGTPAHWSRVTLRQLMGHRSGILNPQFMPGFNALPGGRPLLQSIDFMRAAPLEFEPGSRFAYGNAGAFLLSHVIQQVTGLPRSEFIDARIFKPLGMASSGHGAMPPDAARGYMFLDGEVQPAPPLNGMYSTATDLLKWDQALYDDRLLSPASRGELLGDPEGDGYGLGIFLQEIEGRTASYHGGAAGVYQAMLKQFMDDRVTVIVLSNLLDPTWDDLTAPLVQISWGVARRYFGLPDPPPPVSMQIDPATLDRYVGVYEVFPGGRVTISRQESTLLAQQVGAVLGPPMPAPAQLVAIDAASFLGPSMRIEFPPGEGPARSLIFGTPHLLTERPAHRVEAP